MSLLPHRGRGRPTALRRIGALLAGAVVASLLTAAPALADEPEPPVPMVSVVSVADSQYGLAADRSAVYQRSSAGPGWNRVGGPAKDIYAGGAGLFATNPDTGDLYRYDGTPQGWTPIGGPGADFAVTDDRVYGLAPDQSGIYQWSQDAPVWTRIGGRAKDIYANGADLFATDPDTGAVSRYGGEPPAWTAVSPAAPSEAQRRIRQRPAPAQHEQPQPQAPQGAPLSTPTTPPASEISDPPNGPSDRTPDADHPSDLAVTAEDDLYVLAADHSAVWKRNGTQWDAISSRATAVYAGRLGVFMVDPDTGLINKYNSEAKRWDPIGGGTGQFAVTGGSLYRLTADGIGEWRGDTWTRIGGPAENIYAGGAGLFATDPITGEIRKYDGEPDRWTEVGGPGAAFAVSDKHLYGLTPDRTAVHQWNDDTGDWTRIGGPAENIYAGGAGLFATDPITGKIRKYDGEPDRWTEVGGPGASFAVSDKHLYGLTPDRTAVYQWNDEDGTEARWTPVADGLPGAAAPASRTPFWNKNVKCSQTDPDGRKIPTRLGNHELGWNHFTGRHNIRQCKVIDAALAGKVDKVEQNGTRLTYLGKAFNSSGQVVDITVIVQYAQATADNRYDAGPGQKIGVITAYCNKVKNNKCPNWVNQ
ncbi:hypothetical protein [Streptomyces sp. NPDC097640]|uniref:hypothetical protein n=1 Tax=Streptomyces sp. NPDC097640 TaxID=3157229 RepID=UPI00332A4CC0